MGRFFRESCFGIVWVIPYRQTHISKNTKYVTKALALYTNQFVS